MKYELIIIWDTGEKATHIYNTYRKALEAEKNFKMVFGRQISWMGINEKRA